MEQYKNAETEKLSDYLKSKGYNISENGADIIAQKDENRIYDVIIFRAGESSEYLNNNTIAIISMEEGHSNNMTADMIIGMIESRQKIKKEEYAWDTWGLDRLEKQLKEYGYKDARELRKEGKTYDGELYYERTDYPKFKSQFIKDEAERHEIFCNNFYIYEEEGYKLSLEYTRHLGFLGLEDEKETDISVEDILSKVVKPHWWRIDMTEMDELEAYLKEKGIPYKRHDRPDGDLGEFHQIKCDGWDAVCHRESDGGEEGLLEVSNLKLNKDAETGKPVGFLTADEIISYLDQQQNIRKGNIMEQSKNLGIEKLEDYLASKGYEISSEDYIFAERKKDDDLIWFRAGTQKDSVYIKWMEEIKKTDNMTAEDIINMLENRQKFEREDYGWDTKGLDQLEERLKEYGYGVIENGPAGQLRYKREDYPKFKSPFIKDQKERHEIHCNDFRISEEKDGTFSLEYTAWNYANVKESKLTLEDILDKVVRARDWVLDLTEMDKLEAYLKETGIPYTRHDRPDGVWGEFHQIVCDRWDVVCHKESYGGSDGLLETWHLELNKDAIQGGTAGHLTADEIISYLDQQQNKSHDESVMLTEDSEILQDDGLEELEIPALRDENEPLQKNKNDIGDGHDSK